MDSGTVVNTYKSLARLERDFRSIKNIDLELRPTHHWTQAPGHQRYCVADRLSLHGRPQDRRGSPIQAPPGTPLKSTSPAVPPRLPPVVRPGGLVCACRVGLGERRERGGIEEHEAHQLNRSGFTAGNHTPHCFDGNVRGVIHRPAVDAR